MPSISEKQRKLMAAAAHDIKLAKKVGIPEAVAKEFNNADVSKKKTTKEKIKSRYLKKD